MNIYEVINFLKTYLEANITNTGDLMYGYNVVTDPQSELEKKVPLVLIEADRTEFYNSSEYGTPAAQDHYLSLTVLVGAHKKDFDNYKSRVNTFVKKLIDKIITIDDYKLSKIIPLEMAHNEVMIGALLCTGIVITLKIRTEWDSNSV